jgi:hypothetical protein
MYFVQLVSVLIQKQINGKPKNVSRGKIRGNVPRKRSRKTA